MAIKEHSGIETDMIEEFGNPDINALLAQLEKSCREN